MLWLAAKQALFSRNGGALLAGCPRHIKSVLNLIVEILIAWVLGLPPETRDTQANILLDIHVIANWHVSNRVSTDQCHMTVLRVQASVQLMEVTFFLSYPAVGFNWLQAQDHNEKAL